VVLVFLVFVAVEAEEFAFATGFVGYHAFLHPALCPLSFGLLFFPKG